MNNLESKKVKRRKTKGTVVKPNASSNDSSRENAAVLQVGLPPEESEEEKMERLIDAPDDTGMGIKLLARGPNPFLAPERACCILCSRQLGDMDDAEAELEENSNQQCDVLQQLPIYMCQECRQMADSDMDKKVTSDPTFLQPDLTPEMSFLSGMDALPEPTLPNGTLCNCEACTERRRIAADHDRETAELQQCWNELRSKVRDLYQSQTPMLKNSEGEYIDQLVHRLCSRDPHQLFLRLESQVREFVMEKRALLQKQLSQGYKTPRMSGQFLSLLLEEWNQLCTASSQTSKWLTDLKMHLQRFKITWELHNKHLYQSIVYTDPSIHNSLNVCMEQLRQGAGYEAGFPNLLRDFHIFQNEMSVVLVVWRECHQLVEAYNDEQGILSNFHIDDNELDDRSDPLLKKALKMKQRWLREDWEFFKAQRKMLEEQVLKGSHNSLSHSMEQQFTETMRNMLSGSKTSADSPFCSRCNRKRCPCDECSITHLITCGIINPESFENTEHGFHFSPDTSRYVVNVTPPSMSSTTSSSGSSSPSPLETPHLPLHYPLNPIRNGEDIQELIDGESRSEEDEDEEEDDEDGEEDGVDEDEEEEDEESFGDADAEEDEEEDEEGRAGNEDCLSPTTLAAISTPEIVAAWRNMESMQVLTSAAAPSPGPNLNASNSVSTPNQDNCACHHCQAPPPTDTLLTVQTAEEGNCGCAACMVQTGKGMTTALPTQVPRPAGLHLYPHIHGFAGPRSHRSILQPQLYGLHNPVAAAATAGKLPGKLDLNSPGQIQEHLYHAFSEWDNSYEAGSLAGHYSAGDRLDSELLPPVSLALLANQSYLEQLAIASQHHAIPVPSSTPLPGTTFKPPGSTAPSSVPASSQVTTQTVSQAHLSERNNWRLVDDGQKGHCPSSTQPSHVSPASSSPSPASATVPSHPRSKAASPTCPRPLTVGGNASSQVPKSDPGALPVQHCKKHGSAVLGKAGLAPHTVGSGGQGMVGPGSQVLGSGGILASPSASHVDTLKKLHNSLGPLNPLNYGCQHSSSLRPPPGQPGFPPPPSLDHMPPGGAGNVSVGTSTGGCHDPDCDGRHDDNCDSVDDSSSEKSTSTNTSNQKEGKYCDCCYCEFFGHGTPAQVATSKNYPEMRERLRRRLKQKQTVAKVEETVKLSPTFDVTKQSMDENLDEVLKFIEGKKQAGGGALTESPSSAKALKRARQKERKALERQRRDEEARLKELAQQEAEKKRQAEEARAREAALQAQAASAKKRKNRHKAAPKENLEPEVDLSPAPSDPCPSTVKPPALGTRNQQNTLLECRVSQGQNQVESSSSSSSSIAPSKRDAKASLQPSSKGAKQSSSPAKDVSDKSGPKSDGLPKGTPPAMNGRMGHSLAWPVNMSSNQLFLPLPPRRNHTVAGASTTNNHSVSSSPGKKGRPQQEAAASVPVVQQNGTALSFHPPCPPTRTPPSSTELSAPARGKHPEHPQINGVIREPLCPSTSPSEQQSAPGNQQRPDMTKAQSKNKKKNKKTRGDDGKSYDDVFMPRSESDLEAGEMDEVEKELEEFKRFCSTPQPPPGQRKKIPVNVNIKDIFSKRK